MLADVESLMTTLITRPVTSGRMQYPRTQTVWQKDLEEEGGRVAGKDVNRKLRIAEKVKE